MAMGALLIETIGLSKDYVMGGETVHALRDVSLSVGKGEFVAIMGPSGSGKSTFMNLLGCLDSPTRGQLFIGGEEVSRLSSNRLAAVRNRKLGFVFQQFNLLARTSALDNVQVPLIYAGMSTAERKDKALKRLDEVGLSGRLDHHPSQLSGGQQQRVAIARALVNDPEIILADEPTGALDSKTGEEIMALFQTLNASGMTIILVTHEQNIADYAKRTLTFHDGEVISDTASSDRIKAAQ